MQNTQLELEKYKDVLLEKLAFANVAIVKNDGKPHVSPVWFDMSEADFQHAIININTAKGRVKARNIHVGTPIAMTILDPDNSYSYIGIEGEVIERIEGIEAEQHIDGLAKKYINKDVYPYRVEGEERIKLKVKILTVHKR